MKHPVRNERGVALILVLLMVSIIVVFTLQLNVSSRAQVYEAANLGDGIKVLYIAKSGIFAAMGLLAEDANDVDTLNETWARTEGLTEQTKAYFDGGRVELAIEDESGKIPVNKLVDGNGFNPAVKGLLTRLLSQPQFKLSERQVDEIVNAIKDWIDQDSEVTETGAENAYYQALDKPYAARNAPMESIDELLLVRGITGELFDGTEDRPGLARCLTIHGEGKININTAPKEVLRALAPAVTEDMAARMDDHRRNSANNLSDPQWVRKIGGMENVALDTALLVTKSEYFSIIATGHLGTMKRTVRSVVKRDNEKKLSVIAWRLG